MTKISPFTTKTQEIIDACRRDRGLLPSKHMEKTVDPSENTARHASAGNTNCRPRKMYAPCRPYELKGSAGMDVWIKPEIGRRVPVVVIPVPTTKTERWTLVNKIRNVLYCQKLIDNGSVIADLAFEEAAYRVLVHLGLMPKPRP